VPLATRVAARLGMSITGGSLEQILQAANTETRLVLGSLEAGNNVEADIGGHVDGVNVKVSSVEPKVLCLFCLFI
jgi:hypothetical protein